jgi:hypothetical protein
MATDGGTADILAWKDEAGALHVVPIDLVVSHEDDRSAEVTSHPVEKGADINDHIVQQPDKLTLEIAQTNTPFPTANQPGVAFTAPKGFAAKSLRLQVRPSQFTPPTSETLNVQENAFKPGGLLFLTSAAGAAVGALTNALGLTSPEGALKTSPTLTKPKADEVTVSVFQSDTPIDRIGELHDVLIDVKQKGRFCRVTFRGKVYPDYVITRVKWGSAKGEAGLGRFTLELQSIRIVENAVAKLPDPASLRLKLTKTQAKPLKPVEDPVPGAKGGKGESLLSKGTGLGV